MLLIFDLQATPIAWQIIPKDANITFTATQNGAPVSGQFKTFSGTIVFDPKDLKNSHTDIVIDIHSLSTSYKEVHDTLLTTDWFAAKQFPQAEFKAEGVQKTGENTYETSGILTIKDKNMPVTLQFETKLTAPNQLIFIGSTTIKRTNFGIGQGEWQSTDALKDEVVIHFNMPVMKK